jgi:hypothetical protein
MKEFASFALKAAHTYTAVPTQCSDVPSWLKEVAKSWLTQFLHFSLLIFKNVHLN